MELNGKRVAVLVENLYEDLELWYPVLRFREAGAEVSIVGAGAHVIGSTVEASLVGDDARVIGRQLKGMVAAKDEIAPAP